jgi:tellurite resistance protein TerC
VDLGYTADQAERNRIFALLTAEEDQIRKLAPKYRQKVRDEEDLMKLLRRAHAEHDASLGKSTVSGASGE